MKKVWIGLLSLSLGILLVAATCRHKKGGGNKTDPPPPPPPPEDQRMALEELRARDKAVAERVESCCSLETALVVAWAKGGPRPSLASLPVDYWSADVALRLALGPDGKWGTADDDPRAAKWFSDWVVMRKTEWAGYPRGSENHQSAVAMGVYAATMILGQARVAQLGGPEQGRGKAILNDFLQGRWTCCGDEPGKPGTHPPDKGEIIGSRHYSVRSWSDIWACADLCDEPERTMAGKVLDSAVAFIQPRHMIDDAHAGVWPEDTIPQVRSERDDLCYWERDNRYVKAIWGPLREKYAFLTKHPSFTPYISYVIDSRLKVVNPDFTGHYLRYDQCGGTCKNGCQEAAEFNNAGLLVCGTNWRPKK